MDEQCVVVTRQEEEELMCVDLLLCTNCNWSIDFQKHAIDSLCHFII